MERGKRERGGRERERERREEENHESQFFFPTAHSVFFLNHLPFPFLPSSLSLLLARSRTLFIAVTQSDITLVKTESD
jgi:hypothetical protein